MDRFNVTRFISIKGPDRRVFSAILIAIMCLAVLEIGLQIRSHLRFGQSVLNAFTKETRYVINNETGLKTLRPNQLFSGSQVEMKTNSLGLRSPEIDLIKPHKTVRIAVIGASTVMGAYSATNDDTFTMLLGSMLRTANKNRRFEMINAGIAGYGLADQKQMLEKIILPLQPDLVIVYPGFNDFADYCRAEGLQSKSNERTKRQGLPLLETPNWLLSIELLMKNTVGLRTIPHTTTEHRSANALDLSEYRNKLSALVEALARSNIPSILSTNARAYRRDQPLTEQEELSESARYFNPCFDLDGLHTLYDLHNDEIEHIAGQQGIMVVPLGNKIPGGKRYFSDASHFSAAGEKLAAKLLFEFIESAKAIPDKL